MNEIYKHFTPLIEESNPKRNVKPWSSMRAF